jgi:hypothetical protein
MYHLWKLIKRQPLLIKHTKAMATIMIILFTYQSAFALKKGVKDMLGDNFLEQDHLAQKKLDTHKKYIDLHRQVYEE